MKDVSTLDDLSDCLRAMPWFSRLGIYPESTEFVVNRTLAADPDVPDSWDWLPTTPDQVDPVHDPLLKQVARELGCEALMTEATRRIYKETL